MKDIASLQEAVETARLAYARASEQHARARKHALGLIHIVEEQVRDTRIELSQIDIQRERLTREYGQLRQMLHTLVMAVEVGAAGTSGIHPAAIETRPNGVTPLVPVVVASEPEAPAAVAALDSRARRPLPQAEAAKPGAGAEALRAGLKRMLKKNRISTDEIESVQAEGSEAPAPAE